MVETAQTPVIEVQRLNMKQRIRDLDIAHDGSLWVLEDGKDAHLLRLLPK